MVAIADKSDQYHEKASKHLRKLVDAADRLVTSNLVVHETFMLLARRVSRDAALTFLDAILQDSNVEVLHTDEMTEFEAYKLLRKYDDHDFSVADGVSFVHKRPGREFVERDGAVQGR